MIVLSGNMCSCLCKDLLTIIDRHHYSLISYHILKHDLMFQSTSCALNLKHFFLNLHKTNMAHFLLTQATIHFVADIDIMVE